jgi:hypothetical protein
MDKLLAGLMIAGITVVLIVVVSLLLAWPTMLLWNWLMPLIFGLRTLTFLQALGLMILSSLLLKSSSSSSK